MKIKVFASEHFPADHWEAWEHQQQNRADLASPYFRAEFTQAVAKVRDDAEVGVIYQAGEPVGFFPFQRQRGRRGKPIGGRLSDYQAIIGSADLVADPRELLRACRLAVWDFDHLLVSQSGFHSYHQLVDQSPVMDFDAGFEHYRASLPKSGADELKQTLRKSRKLEREVGPLRLEIAERDPQILKQLIAWKRQQYQSTNITDIFAYPWTVQLLHLLQTHRDPVFAGLLSVLYAGTTPVAMHMGMRSGRVLHWWFPTYDPQFGKYSPGRVLLLHLAQRCPTEGIHRIDLGRGVAPYKKRVMSGATLVSQGSVDLRPISRTVRRGWQQTRQWVRNSALAGTARAPAQVLYRMREWMEFR